APGFDSLRPRPAFAALAEEWGEKLAPVKTPRLHPQGVVNAASLAASVTPGGLVSFFGEELAAASARADDSALPLHVGLTSACMASQPLPLLFVDPSQINAQAPWETPLGRAAAFVYRAGVASNIVS